MLGPEGLPSSSITYFWRLRDPVPGWDDLTTPSGVTLWRPLAPIAFGISRVGRDGLNFSMMEDEKFTAEQRAHGCTVGFLDVFHRALLFICKTRAGLEDVTWEDLHSAVFKCQFLSFEACLSKRAC